MSTVHFPSHWDAFFSPIQQEASPIHESAPDSPPQGFVFPLYLSGLYTQEAFGAPALRPMLLESGSN